MLGELGLRKPPSGNAEGLALLGEPVWVGAFGWGGGPLTGVTGRKVSTQRNKTL